MRQELLGIHATSHPSSPYYELITNKLRLVLSWSWSWSWSWSRSHPQLHISSTMHLLRLRLRESSPQGYEGIMNSHIDRIILLSINWETFLYDTIRYDTINLQSKAKQSRASHGSKNLHLQWYLIPLKGTGLPPSPYPLSPIIWRADIDQGKTLRTLS
jgi:hypothetical protein